LRFFGWEQETRSVRRGADRAKTKSGDTWPVNRYCVGECRTGASWPEEIL